MSESETSPKQPASESNANPAASSQNPATQSEPPSSPSVTGAEIRNSFAKLALLGVADGIGDALADPEPMEALIALKDLLVSTVRELDKTP